MVAMQKWYQIWQNGWAMWCILRNNENENQLAMSNIQIIPSKSVTDENETMEKPLASINTLQIEVTLGTVFYSLQS